MRCPAPRAASYSVSGSVLTIRRVVGKLGWRGTLRKVIADLRLGGPRLLLQKYRRQHASLSQAEACARHQALSAPSHMPPAHEASSANFSHGFALASSEFDRIYGSWGRHPALADLIEQEKQPRDWLLVVSPHPTLGFNALAETVHSAARLSRGVGAKLAVILYAPLAMQPEVLPRAQDGVRLFQVTTASDLKGVLAQFPAWLAHFIISGDAFHAAYASILTSSQLNDCDVILTDMFFVDEWDKVRLVLLPGVNPIHALNVDYFLSRAIVRVSCAAEALNGRVDDVGELVIALMEGTTEVSRTKCRHIAFPLLKVAESAASLSERRLRLLTRDQPIRLRPEESNCQPVRRECRGRVSVVICTKDNGFLVEQLVNRLQLDAEEIADVVVVSNRTSNGYALQLHERLSAQRSVKLIKYDEPFNFSAQCNLGASVGSGEILLFLNDDVVPVNADWLRELVAPLDDPKIGIVGPLLLYPDQSVQHAGMFLGFERVAGHVLRGVRLPEGDCGFLASAPRQVMAVTGAALCMRRKDFEVLNGFDRNRFALTIQDVDLCLRAHFSGMAVVFNPRSILLHMESVSVRPTLSDPGTIRRRALEHEAFAERWGDVVVTDMFHNLNCSRSDESLKSLEAW
jgi:GT2 family glycosyltransferase